MKIKTAELTGRALDWVVAGLVEINEKITTKDGKRHATMREKSNWRAWADHYRPSTEWEYGGPIIDMHITGVFAMNTPAEGHCAHVHERKANGSLGKVLHRGYGPTKLIAAMRCFVASKLGDEVEVPEELL